MELFPVVLQVVFRLVECILCRLDFLLVCDPFPLTGSCVILPDGALIFRVCKILLRLLHRQNLFFQRQLFVFRLLALFKRLDLCVDCRNLIVQRVRFPVDRLLQSAFQLAQKIVRVLEFPVDLLLPFPPFGGKVVDVRLVRANRPKILRLCVKRLLNLAHLVLLVFLARALFFHQRKLGFEKRYLFLVRVQIRVRRTPAASTAGRCTARFRDFLGQLVPVVKKRLIVVLRFFLLACNVPLRFLKRHSVFLLCFRDRHFGIFSDRVHTDSGNRRACHASLQGKCLQSCYFPADIKACVVENNQPGDEVVYLIFCSACLLRRLYKPGYKAVHCAAGRFCNACKVLRRVNIIENRVNNVSKPRLRHRKLSVLVRQEGDILAVDSHERFHGRRGNASRLLILCKCLRNGFEITLLLLERFCCFRYFFCVFRSRIRVLIQRVRVVGNCIGFPIVAVDNAVFRVLGEIFEIRLVLKRRVVFLNKRCKR